MHVRAFKYLGPVLIYIAAIRSFLFTGWMVWLPLIYTWIAIPLLELLLKPSSRNLSAAEEELARADSVYDWLLYLIVPLQYSALVLFLASINDSRLTGIDLAGRTMVMGLLCGTLGINVGHELGHRSGKTEQALAKMLLLTSLYTHFFIEHNKGHHKRVATPDDPSSARMGEPVYIFYLRSMVLGYRSAWQIACKEAQKRKQAAFSWGNEMIRLQLLQVVFVLVIYAVFGARATGLFGLAALQGILLLETVNYIEHYGLSRRAIGQGKWERALPKHSWNSNHVVGRIMLFELSRHSDHHYLASRKYQVLRHHEGAPQMPTGYPGMMLLSLVPPLWFWVMHRQIRKEQKKLRQ